MIEKVAPVQPSSEGTPEKKRRGPRTRKRYNPYTDEETKAMQKAEREKNAKEIIEIDRKAKAAGMSYGKYVLQQQLLMQRRR